MLHALMNMTPLEFMVNLVMFSLIPINLFCVIWYPRYADWVRNLIEDGDETPHKSDARDAVILFSAYMLLWLLLNIILDAMKTGNDRIGLMATVGGVLCALLGVKALNQVIKH